MILQRIQWRIRRRQHLDLEPFKQRPRPELRRLQLLGNRVVVLVCRLLAQPLFQPEQLLKLIVQPHARRRSTEQLIVARKCPPHLPRILHHRLPNLQLIQRYTLAVEHAIHIVVRLNQQLRRIGKRLIPRKPPRLCVAMWTHNRQVANTFIKGAGNRAHIGLGREQAIVVDQHIGLLSWLFATGIQPL